MFIFGICLDSFISIYSPLLPLFAFRITGGFLLCCYFGWFSRLWNGWFSFRPLPIFCAFMWRSIFFSLYVVYTFFSLTYGVSCGPLEFRHSSMRILIAVQLSILVLNVCIEFFLILVGSVNMYARITVIFVAASHELSLRHIQASSSNRPLAVKPCRPRHNSVNPFT